MQITPGVTHSDDRMISLCKRLLIRWAVMILKFIIINLMLSTMADYALFGPLQMLLHQDFGLNDDAGGYGDTEDLNGGAGRDGEGDVDAGED